MNIWVDICHTPHVLLTAPIIREFEKMGHSVVITARNCFQIGDLLNLHGFQYKIIGQYYGGSKFLKLYGIIARSLQLMTYAREFNFKLSLSIGSPYQSIASSLLRIPYFIINDYEHSSIFNIVRYTARRMFFPTYISDDVLKLRGIALEKVIKFPGLKEDIYLADFMPNKNILKVLNNHSEDDIIIILRPPASTAHYHNPKSDQLMLQILEHFKKQSNLVVIIIARGEDQRKQFYDYKARADGFGDRLIIPEEAIDTLSLLYYSDLMIGGGGTMNREAAALGVPTYSFFCGPMGEVDLYLQKIGKLHFISSEKDIFKIRLKKKNRAAPNDQSKKDLKSYVIQQILDSL